MNRFTFNILIRILLIAFTSFAFTWAVQKDYMLITSSTLGLIWAGQVLYLFYYINRFKRDLDKFIEAFKNQDTSLFFNIKRNNRYFSGLYKNLNEITRNFRLVRIDREVEHRFFKATVEHVGSGLLAFDSDGNVRLINNAALKMLNLEWLNNIKSLYPSFPGLSDKLVAMKSGGQHFLSLVVKNEMKHISVRTSDIELSNERIKLLSLQDISREIDRSEVEAWQKLIRVFTHEIINTVSPLSLLSESLVKIFEENGTKRPLYVIDDQSIDNVLLGLHAIQNRTKGLAKFVQTYQDLTKIPEPDINPFKVIDILYLIKTLISEDLLTSKTEINIVVSPPDLTLTADEKLVQQVLINLVKNAMEAMENVDNRSIKIEANKKEGSVCIAIADNGKGIPSEMLDNVFVPFFTTKKGGSGIGLSISRQIMQMHNGNIKLKSKPGRGSVFILEF